MQKLLNSQRVFWHAQYKNECRTVLGLNKKVATDAQAITRGNLNSADMTEYHVWLICIRRDAHAQQKTTCHISRPRALSLFGNAEKKTTNEHRNNVGCHSCSDRSESAYTGVNSCRGKTGPMPHGPRVVSLRPSVPVGTWPTRPSPGTKPLGPMRAADSAARYVSRKDAPHGRFDASQFLKPKRVWVCNNIDCSNLRTRARPRARWAPGAGLKTNELASPRAHGPMGRA